MPTTHHIIIPDRTRPGETTSASTAIGQQGSSGNSTNAGRTQNGRKRKKPEIRIGSLNVGSMTGRSREIADTMERRRINILCVQETKWKGSKARQIGGGYKLFYHGDNGGRNGVGVILDGHLAENVVEVKRISDRLMWLRLVVNTEMVTVVSAYAPQPGCNMEEKETFWKDLDEEIMKLDKSERLFIGGDLNGHVGENNEGEERWRGKYGYGKRNEEGNEIVKFASRTDMAILNTFFRKKCRITYESGGRKSQVDYLMCWRRNLKEVSDCGSLPGERVVTQHKVVMGKVSFGYNKNREKRAEKKTKWWKLKEETQREEFATIVKSKLGESFPQDWKLTADTIRCVAKEVLGVSSGRGKVGKETWWWNERVQEAIGEKRKLKKQMDINKDSITKEQYKVAKKEAKRAVAKAKSESVQGLYDELETKEGQNKIYRVAKQRDKSTRDIHHIKMMKSKEGKVLEKHEQIRQRWKTYYEELMNEENEREKREEEIQAIEIEVEEISKKEVWEAVCKMKTGKAVGPDEIPAEVWKYLGDEGCNFLVWLFNDILKNERMPEEWTQSTLVPIYKNKGDIQDCSNYRGIKLMSHTMKIWERIIDKRIRQDVKIGEEQFGFVAGKSTNDAIFALRRTAEKYREKQKELHCVFIDLEKAYDRVPREEVWHCMKSKGVAEKYIRVIMNMYEGSNTVVRSAAGVTEPFKVGVGLHQGSALSPLLFAIVMDVLTDQIRRQAPWNMLYADDVVLLNDTKKEAEIELEWWRSALEKRGLRVSKSKTEYLCIGQKEVMPPIRIDEEVLPEASQFKYLGSTVHADGNNQIEVNKRIQAGWTSWRKVTGVMCDKRIPAKLKGKVYTSVVRPAMLYGLESVAITKGQEKQLEVAEMRMLRWSLGWTRKDRIRNERIRELTGVSEITRKMREERLRWFGHIKRREDEYVGRRVLEMEVEGTRRRGRPKRRWREDIIKTDMEELGLEEDDAYDRKNWKYGIQYGDPTKCGIS